jgi:hypothetical protein
MRRNRPRWPVFLSGMCVAEEAGKEGFFTAARGVLVT